VKAARGKVDRFRDRASARVFVASAPNASAQIAANKGKDFIVAPLSTDRRSDDAQAPLWM
jgi:hypothetical protein